MFNQTFNQTLRLTLWGIVFISLLLFTSFHANAQLPSSVDRTSIGIGLNQLPGAPVSWSGNAAMPFGNDSLNGFIAALLQSNGTITRGRFHAEIGKDFGKLRGEVYADGTAKGKGITSLGHDIQTGANAVVPIGSLELKLGIAGKSGGEMAKPNAYDALAALGYDENELELYTNPSGKTLAEQNPASTGLSFQNRNSLILRGAIELNLPLGISGEFVIMPELTGSSTDIDSEPLDQLIITLNKSYALNNRFSIHAGADIAFQRFRHSGTTEDAVAGRVSANMMF